MSRTLVPMGLRDLLNVKLKKQGWASVRNFGLSTGLCTPDTYSTETITRVFNARDGETKGTELSTIANVLRFLDTPMAEIREILEQFYPEKPHQMFWSLLGSREVELKALERSFLDVIHSVIDAKPEKTGGLISAIEAYAIAIDADCGSALTRIRKILKEGGYNGRDKETDV